MESTGTCTGGCYRRPVLFHEAEACSHKKYSQREEFAASRMKALTLFPSPPVAPAKSKLISPSKILDGAEKRGLRACDFFSFWRADSYQNSIKGKARSKLDLRALLGANMKSRRLTHFTFLCTWCAWHSWQPFLCAKTLDSKPSI